MGMGRKRKHTPAWVPRNCFLHGARVYFRSGKMKPVNLGPISDPSAVLSGYAKIITRPVERPRTMGDVIDRYLIEALPKRAERTQLDYIEYCKRLKYAFAHMLPDDINIDHLYAYHEARAAPVRANREITVLGNIYRYAIRWRSATVNPVSGFLYAEERPRERLVSSAERRKFALHCPDWLRGYLALKYLTGRRQGELLTLGLFSEQRDGIVFRILKKRRKRELVIEWSPRLRRIWEWLKKQRRPKSSLMLFHGERAAVKKNGFGSAWQRAMKSYVAAGGERFQEHDIRAATASAAASDGRAQELMDHEDARTTRRVYRRAQVSKIKPL